ncbi:alpha-galactosidase [Bifidobacterium sp. SO1]|uniref:alpha-galactosidase n=1 Tax=Bifidobacterium sp. SO1 TaxID=2809029 RepID=UPI001F0B71C3|nr:alpha-galactosidase [Bifidobacterium sp. SO1]
MPLIEQFQGTAADGTDLTAVYAEQSVANVAIALVFPDDNLPRFVHWGRPLADPGTVVNLYDALRPQRVSGALDDTAWPSILPTQSESWLGAPRFVVRRDGVELYCKFAVEAVTAALPPAGQPDDADSARLAESAGSAGSSGASDAGDVSEHHVAGGIDPGHTAVSESETGRKPGRLGDSCPTAGGALSSGGAVPGLTAVSGAGTGRKPGGAGDPRLTVGGSLPSDVVRTAHAATQSAHVTGSAQSARVTVGDRLAADRPARVTVGDELAADRPAHVAVGRPEHVTVGDELAATRDADPQPTPTITVEAADREQGVGITWTCELDESGLVRQKLEIANLGAGSLEIGHVELGFPLPADTSEILTATGHHLRERSPQRQPLTVGRFEKLALAGRPDFDASLLLSAGEPGFGFTRGDVYAVHVGWSGNSVLSAERLPYTTGVIGGGEVLLGGEVTLPAANVCAATSDSPTANDVTDDRAIDRTEADVLPAVPVTTATYTTPWVYGSFGHGLNEVAARFHAYLRNAHHDWRRAHGVPDKPRPVILNTWEAVYFDQNYDTLTALADKAAAIGVERFVVDDGWFGSRRDDTSGLGDWQVSQDVWPDGPKSLRSLADYVHGLGMEFGLWFEPEMVNPDSDLFRAHPDWVLRPTANRLPMQGRSQQVVDLTNPDAYAYVYDAIDTLVGELGIDYIKWDHNKLVTEAVSPRTGRPAIHAQTLAVYRIFRDLKEAHPRLEIESCSSGGGRVDLGILELADRIWVSDCVDPVERADIQRYTSLLVPPFMMGEHVGASPAHSTHRATSQEMRMTTAFFGHLGVEWNLLKEPDADVAKLGEWIAEFKKHREWFAVDTCVHLDCSDPAVRLDGMVKPDRSAAFYRFTQLTTSATYPAAPIRVPGLDPDGTYRIQPLWLDLDLAGLGIGNGQSALGWWTPDGVLLTGRALATYGLRPPTLHPAQAVLFTAIRQ